MDTNKVQKFLLIRADGVRDQVHVALKNSSESRFPLNLHPELSVMPSQRQKIPDAAGPRVHPQCERSKAQAADDSRALNKREPIAIDPTNQGRHGTFLPQGSGRRNTGLRYAEHGSTRTCQNGTRNLNDSLSSATPAV